MATYDITAPDGQKYRINAPDTASESEVMAYAQKSFKTAEPPPETTLGQDIKQGAGNLLAGAVRGAGSIGATIVAPWDIAKDAIAGKGLSLESNRQRRADMDSALGSMGAETDSWMYKGGKLGGEIAGTAGAGGLLAKPVQALAASRYGSGLEPILSSAATALQTGGFRAGEMAGTGLGNAMRVVAGAATGGTAAGLTNPEDAGFGALVGGALPGAAMGAGKVGNAIRGALGKGTVSPEVAALAQKAKDLGINIPADRLVNSKPLNAIASSLNYVPMSGRAATEEAMGSQLNQALSRTFGQNSSNVTMALRKAEEQLGGQFERTLSSNKIVFDKTLLDDVAQVYTKATEELGDDAIKPIAAKIKQLMEKGAGGEIDGKAAYVIKRDLDRLGSSNNPNAWHAIELKKKLMEALDRSLGPDAAKEFSQVRQQYGNMLDLQKLAKNGAEGEISAARIGNIQNINNKQLQDVADIAAQFVKPREGAHGAAQRVFLGAGAATGAAFNPAMWPALAGGVAGGRGVNALLNSNAARRFLLNAAPEAERDMGLLTQSLYRASPLLRSD